MFVVEETLVGSCILVLKSVETVRMRRQTKDKMTGITIYQKLKAAQSEDEKLLIISEAIEKEKSSDIEEIRDHFLLLGSEIRNECSQLKKEVHDFQSHILKELNLQTWRYIGGLAAISILFKIAEMVIK